VGPVSQVLPDHFPFPSGIDWPLISLRASLTDIAQRFQLKIDQWEEDGLGPARGMLVRLPSGRIVLLRELQHAVKHLGAEGPEVHVDAGDLASAGTEPIIADVIDGLQLSSTDIVEVVPKDAQQHAADLIAQLKAFRSK
jgi:hypothetical protein